VICARWQDLLRPGRVDELDQDRRQQFLSHLQGCSSCRRAAAEADPTVVFSLLPAEKVEEREVEEIRRTVQAMRRVRALEVSWSQRARRGLVVGGFAALVLMAVMLTPQRPEQMSPPEVPFAGAVGVGSGLVSVPQALSGITAVDLRVELARSARMADLSSSPAMHRLSHLEVTANAGELVDRDLGHGYRLRFSLPGEVPVGGPVLKSFQLLRSGTQGEISLFNADLQSLPNSPLILGLTPVDEDEGQLWLHLSYSADDPHAP